MRAPLFLFFFFQFGAALAQADHDTTFFDAKWKAIANRKKAAFYRVTEKDSALSLYKITDYYAKTAKVQMTGFLSTSDPKTEEGLFKYYYPDGTLEDEGLYVNGHRSGEWKGYHAKGQLAWQRTYINGETDGMESQYGENGALFAHRHYLNGKKDGMETEYNGKGTLLGRRYYIQDKIDGMDTEYDEKGKPVLQTFYKAGKKQYVSSFERKLQSGFLIRGKALGFVIIEDAFVFNFTAGIEYRFAKYHSIGVDYHFFRNRWEHEVYLDSTYTNYNEYNGYNPRHSAVVDYRFYFPFSISRARSVRPYLQAYGRFGNARIYYEATYPIDSGSVVHQTETFYDVGVTVGLHFGFFPKGKAGLDICAGTYRRSKLQNEEYYNPGGDNWMKYDQPLVEWLPIIRVNLFYYLWGKQQASQTEIEY